MQVFLYVCSMKNVEIFYNRLKKIGIEITLFGNYPWIYFDSINGKRVKEKLGSDHGFVVFIGSDFMNGSDTFNLIRKYMK